MYRMRIIRKVVRARRLSRLTLVLAAFALAACGGESADGGAEADGLSGMVTLDGSSTEVDEGTSTRIVERTSPGSRT